MENKNSNTTKSLKNYMEKHLMKQDLVPVSEVLKLNTTYEVNGEETYAPLVLLPGVVTLPRTKDEMERDFKDGVPRQYFEQLRILSEYENKQKGRANNSKAIFTGGTAVDDNFEVDEGLRDEVLLGLKEKGKFEILNMGLGV